MNSDIEQPLSKVEDVASVSNDFQNLSVNEKATNEKSPIDKFASEKRNNLRTIYVLLHFIIDEFEKSKGVFSRCLEKVKVEAVRAANLGFYSEVIDENLLMMDAKMTSKLTEQVESVKLALSYLQNNSMLQFQYSIIAFMHQFCNHFYPALTAQLDKDIEAIISRYQLKFKLTRGDEKLTDSIHQLRTFMSRTVSKLIEDKFHCLHYYSSLLTSVEMNWTQYVCLQGQCESTQLST